MLVFGKAGLRRRAIFWAHVSLPLGTYMCMGHTSNWNDWKITLVNHKKNQSLLDLWSICWCCGYIQEFFSCFVIVWFPWRIMILVFRSNSHFDNWIICANIPGLCNSFMLAGAWASRKNQDICRRRGSSKKAWSSKLFIPLNVDAVSVTTHST